MSQTFLKTKSLEGPLTAPRYRLYTGKTIPKIGLGTYPNGKYSGWDVANAVYGAVHFGYRLIDCAFGYGDEPEIGQALERLQREGISREELFITSKLINTMHEKEKVLPGLKKSIRDLRMDYLDGYYIHWPFRQFEDQDVKDGVNCKPYCHEEYMETYHELEKAVQEGLILQIGTSNMSQKKYEKFLEDASIKPAFNQMEIHPCFAQRDFVRYLKGHGILPVAYSPIGAPIRPKQYVFDGDVSELQHPIIVEIARKHGVHPAVICIKWSVQNGLLPIPFTVEPNEYIANLKGILEDPLTAEEMEKISGVDCGCRIQRGNDYHWEGHRSWKEVWEEV